MQTNFVSNYEEFRIKILNCFFEIPVFVWVRFSGTVKSVYVHVILSPMSFSWLGLDMRLTTSIAS